MFLFDKQMDSCCGCMSCLNVCPVEAITIKQLDDTFLYPEIDEKKCINCKKCTNHCPIYKQSEIYSIKSSFAMITKSNSDMEKSSSGGAFKTIISILSKQINKDLYVVGSVWDESLNPVHKIIKLNKINDVDVFSKSKFVQSSISYIYKDIKNILDSNSNHLIFSGTPCQVQSLKEYLGKQYSNLTTIDIMCHGVPSLFTFKKYIEEIENNSYSKVVSYAFKNKEVLENGTIYTRSSKYTLDNGNSVYATRTNDPYLKMYYESNAMLRPSCFTCKFKAAERVGDITLGDSWGIQESNPELNPFTGISLVLINSNEYLYIEDIVKKQAQYYSVDLGLMIKNNSALRKNEKQRTNLDDAFFEFINDDTVTFSICVSKYFNLRQGNKL